MSYPFEKAPPHVRIEHVADGEAPDGVPRDMWFLNCGANGEELLVDTFTNESGTIAIVLHFPLKHLLTGETRSQEVGLTVENLDGLAHTFATLVENARSGENRRPAPGRN